MSASFEGRLATYPATGCFNRAPESGEPGDVFGLGVLGEAVAPFAADAALLVAAPAAVEVGDPDAEADVPGSELQGDLPRAFPVGRDDRAGQAELGVVRDSDRFTLVPVGEHAEHRAEDLLAGDGHVRTDRR